MNGGYIWAFLWVPLALLVGMALDCLIRLARERRKGLLTVTVAVGMCAAVLFGGDWLLAGQGMTWRTAPLNVLCALTWAFGLAAGVLTVRYLPRLVPHLAVWAQAAALYCLISVMLFGSFLGLLWAAFAQAGLRERVGSYEGQRVVQVDMTWGEGRSYHLYPYHGPLVRGSEILASSQEPFFVARAETVAP